ncbi:hypothetical protein ACIF8T_09860 [Streptomyces sp. NPDC085946]|uniref:hypothetical protein n=1 Tax=Streptomyces sp. NPDC085946 TaxID=3365744 RepID=UPI0037D008DF
MHAYEVPRRQSLSPIPAPGSRLRPGREVPPPRPAQDCQGGPSATPIYDALYAEYVKSFRSLPGDRSGEEKLGFTAFGTLPHSSDTASYGGTGSYGSTGSYTGSGAYTTTGSYGGSYSAYSAGAQSARQGSGHQPQWQRVGTIGGQGAGGQQAPAALPPARRGGN